MIVISYNVMAWKYKVTGVLRLLKGGGIAPINVLKSNTKGVRKTLFSKWLLWWPY